MAKIDTNTSFLDDALDFCGQKERYYVADALACKLHNTGYSLKGNTDQDGTRPSNLFQCRFQGRQEAGIFGFGADRYAQVFGHAIRRHWPDDDALFEQPLKNVGALAYLDTDKIAMRRNPGQAQTGECFGKCFHPMPIEQRTLLDEFIVE